MEIKRISNNAFFPNSTENISKKKVEPSEQKQDKLEISERANQMSKTNSDSKNIEEIRNRIDSKFYDSDKVIKKISSEILKEINNT